MKNLISWVEIPAADFDRAVNFYNHILDLEMEKMDFGSEKMACLPGDQGAISQAPGFKPSGDGVLVSFNTGDKMEETLSKIENKGGKILTPKTKIEAEGRGYFSVFLDSEGNKLGLYGDN